MTPSIIDQITAYLKRATPQERNEFMRQVLAEKDLYDALRAVNLHAPELENLQGRTIERPHGVLSDIDLVDIRTVTELKSIYAASFSLNLIQNNRFGTGDLTGWRTDKDSLNTHEVVTTDPFSGSYCYHGIRGNVTYKLYQDLPPVYGDDLLIALWLKGTATKAVYLFVEYTDETYDSILHTFSSSTWEYQSLAPTTHKLAKYIYVQPNTNQEYWLGLASGFRVERKLTSTDIVTSILNSDSMKTLRWSVPREPGWVEGSETTAPAANTVLVSKTVTTAMTGRVFGVHITADEGNQFQLLDAAAVKKRFVLGAGGTIHVILATPLLDGIVAGHLVSLRNVTAGTAGKVYQASLLYDEA